MAENTQVQNLANAINSYMNSKLATIGGGSAATINNFTGASASAAGLSGLVPAPQAGDNEKFLRGDGYWVNIGSGETYSEATTLTAGLMPATDKAKLDTLNNYTLPTASTSTKGGVIIGNGLEMNGDTLSVTLSGGSTGGTGSEFILSNTPSNVNGGMWLDSSVVSSESTEAVIVPTVLPVANGSMWLVL